MKIDLLKAALFTPQSGGEWGLPLILWGPPGVAKTATIRAIAKAMSAHLEHLCPGARGEGAFGVTPVPHTNGEMTLAYPPPEWTRLLRDKTEDGRGDEDFGIVFLDEVNTAPPAIQPAIMGIAQERMIGQHRFGIRVRILAAANPTGHAAGGWDLAAPVANRFGHIEWSSPDASEWGAWLLGGAGDMIPSINVQEEEKRVLEEFPQAFASAGGFTSAYIRKRPDQLHKMPPDGDPAQGRAWPSPRSWEYATRALAASKVHRLDNTIREELFAAFVGIGIAGEFFTWMDRADLPDPADLLAGVVEFKHDPKRLDRTEAVLSACAALLISHKKPKYTMQRQEELQHMWELLGKISESAKDVAVPAIAALARAGMATGEKARPVLARMHAVISAAGVGK